MNKMGANNRFWAFIVVALNQSVSGPAVAGSQDVLHGAWTDPYSLSLQSPEKYRLGTQQPDTIGTSMDSSTRVPDLNGQPFQREIANAANEFKVDAALVHAVIQVESGYNAGARSAKGAQGLMQLLPETARRFGVATADLLWKPERNIRAGVAYLRSLLEMFDQDIALVLAAYNAGENAVLRHGRRIPPFPETRDYVPKVLAIYNRLRPPTEPQTTPEPGARIRIQYPPPLPEAQPD
jgi:soluble lytic murein transglycosylase-like protein